MDPQQPEQIANPQPQDKTTDDQKSSQVTPGSEDASRPAGILAALILAALVFIATRDKISTGMVLIAALVLGIFAARKPRVLDYRLDDTGLTIDTKFYDYAAFKSFSVINEGPAYSIFLMPMKRFMPGLSLYYDQKDQQKIADILAQRLPLEDRHVDTIDRFMHRIRF